MDNIRNTQAGHIQIDYRIACAMSNFLHKPCCPDGEYAIDVAKKIREKSLIKINSLHFLLGKQLDTKIFPQINLADIKDFPQIKRKKIRRELFFGTYQFRQSKSYVCELVQNGIAYLLNSKKIEKLINIEKISKSKESVSKVVAFEIKSRHKRSEKSTKTYKVFIQYIPNLDCVSGIEGKTFFKIILQIVLLKTFCFKATFAIVCQDTKSQVAALM